MGYGTLPHGKTLDCTKEKVAKMLMDKFKDNTPAVVSLDLKQFGREDLACELIAMRYLVIQNAQAVVQEAKAAALLADKIQNASFLDTNEGNHHGHNIRTSDPCYQENHALIYLQLHFISETLTRNTSWAPAVGGAR